MTFQEFVQIFLPCEENVLRNVVIERPAPRIGRFDKLPRDIELQMANILEKEVEL